VTLRFSTLSVWDERAWKQVEPIFDEAFPPQGRKTARMVRKIVETSAGFLHIGLENDRPVAMAVTGKLPELNALLIDYIAVASAAQSRGIGSAMTAFLADEASSRGYGALVIEIEADVTAENAARERFWTSAGFVRTDYVHAYRWVPEPYRALYKELRPDAALPHDGEALFRSITSFHGNIWRG